MPTSPPLTSLSADQLCERSAQYVAMAGTARPSNVQASLRRLLAALYATLAAERALEEQARQ
jgi:hypothetical protein